MKNEEIVNLFKKWLKNEKEKLQKRPVNLKEEAQAKRTYIHFDKRRHSSSLFDMQDILLDPKKIAKENSWPFIKFIIKTPKYKKQKDEKNKRVKTIKERPVYYASHKDALIYSWYSFLLNEKYYNKKLKELDIDKCVFAYRKIATKENKNKCNIHFSKEIFDFVSTKGECVAFVADISSFFDNLDHEHLKKEWCNVLGVKKLPPDHYSIFKRLTNFKYVDAEKIYKEFNIKFKDKINTKNKKKYKIALRDGRKLKKICSRSEFIKKVVKNNLIKGNENKNKIETSKRLGKTCGIMQGSPISATLSNIYMISFDTEINKVLQDFGGIYRRYSDDLVVICDKKYFNDIKKIVLDTILKYELKINSNKIDTTYFSMDHKNKLRGFDKDDAQKRLYKNLQYLGFEFNGQDVFTRSSSLSRYYRKMKSRTRKTVNMAYGKKSKTKNSDNVVFKKTLFKKYLYQGRRSFISYAYRAIEIFGSKSLKDQLSGRFNIMTKYIEKIISKKEDDKKKFEKNIKN